MSFDGVFFGYVDLQKASPFLSLSLPRQHPVGKQNRQAIVKGCEVVEQFDLPALE